MYTSETYTGGLQPIGHCKVLLAENVATLQDGAAEKDNHTCDGCSDSADGEGQKQLQCLCGSEKADDWLAERKSVMAERQW